MKIVYSLTKITDELMIDKAEVLFLEKTNGITSNIKDYALPAGTYIKFKNNTKIFVEQDIEEVYRKLYE
mgnify:FL=1